MNFSNFSLFFSEQKYTYQTIETCREFCLDAFIPYQSSLFSEIIIPILVFNMIGLILLQITKESWLPDLIERDYRFCQRLEQGIHIGLIFFNVLAIIYLYILI